MSEIDTKFDGISWEWKGKNIRDLKPICPDCQFELDIETPRPKIHCDPKSLKFKSMSVIPVSYSCPKCSFSRITSIDNVNSPQDLLKEARKVFEHRQRLNASEKTKG
jgi:hypothetical protein